MNSSSSSSLDASVLVLNKLFMAIHIISVRRAFCLLCKDLAEVVSLEDGQYATYDFSTWREVSEYRARNFREEDDDWIRTINSEIQENFTAMLKQMVQRDDIRRRRPRGRLADLGRPPVS